MREARGEGMGWREKTVSWDWARLKLGTQLVSPKVTETK